MKFVKFNDGLIVNSEHITSIEKMPKNNIRIFFSNTTFIMHEFDTQEQCDEAFNELYLDLNFGAEADDDEQI